jgi:ElaB/YqjD/DUF883 family membrane-anchored ribosome-binding protein
MKRRKNGNGIHTVEQRFDALKADFDALQKDLRGLANDVPNAARDSVNRLIRNGEDARDEVEAWTNENIGSLRDSIRDQPLASCILSMSAGALLGALMLRR